MFWLDEDLMRNEGTGLEGSTAVFNWNRITGGSKKNGLICLEFTPLRREFEVPLEYVVDRFRSFGNSTFRDFADQIQKLIDAGPVCQYNQELMFPETAAVLQELKGTSYMLFAGDFG